MRIHDGDTHTVQTAGVLVVVLVELAACMQPGEDQFDARDFFLRVLVDRHAAPVVGTTST